MRSVSCSNSRPRQPTPYAEDSGGGRCSALPPRPVSVQTALGSSPERPREARRICRRRPDGLRRSSTCSSSCSRARNGPLRRSHEVWCRLTPASSSTPTPREAGTRRVLTVPTARRGSLRSRGRARSIISSLSRPLPLGNPFERRARASKPDARRARPDRLAATFPASRQPARRAGARSMIAWRGRRELP